MRLLQWGGAWHDWLRVKEGSKGLKVGVEWSFLEGRGEAVEHREEISLAPLQQVSGQSFPRTKTSNTVQVLFLSRHLQSSTAKLQVAHDIVVASQPRHHAQPQ